MPTVEQLIERVSSDAYEKIAEKAINHYMEENSDLYDDLAEDVANRIRGDERALERIKEAAVNNIINNLEEGTDSQISIGALDGLAGELNELMVEKLRLAIRSM